MVGVKNPNVEVLWVLKFTRFLQCDEGEKNQRYADKVSHEQNPCPRDAFALKGKRSKKPLNKGPMQVKQHPPETYRVSIETVFLGYCNR